MSKFKHPFTCIVSGPTSSGKTSFVVKMIEHKDKIIDPPPERIVWCFSEWQPLYESLKQLDVEVFEGIPSDDKLVSDKTSNHLIVFDDLMNDKIGKKKLLEWFIKKSHHRNASVIYITQNLFEDSKEYRTMSLNTHYMILFKNMRDKIQIASLARQMYIPGLLKIYDEVTSKLYNPLIIDLHPKSKDDDRLMSDIFNVEGVMVHNPHFHR